MKMTTDNIFVKENKFLGEKYYYTKHSSGLDIYVFPKALTTSYALFGTRYGSIDNKFQLVGDQDYTVVPDGIAHFLEHKMFENENGEDTFLRYAKTGASANAYTSFDMTAYLFSCTNRFYESLEILLDFVTNPYFTPETVEKEQGIIAQEIRMGEDNPGRCIIFDLLKAMYKKHTVRIDIAGTVNSISNITSDILYSCYNAFYNLHNMALCVCGDVSVDKTLETADRILKVQPDFNVQSFYEREEREVAKPYITRKMQVAKPLFNIGIKDTDISLDGRKRMKKNAIISILNDILFGRAGDFYNDLYSAGLISDSFGYWSEHNKSFSFVSISGESDDPSEVYKRFKNYIALCLEKGLNAEDVERCKRISYAAFIKGFDSTDTITNSFLTFIFDDGDMLDYVDVISSVTYNDVNQTLHDMYHDECFSLATIFPLD